MAFSPTRPCAAKLSSPHPCANSLKALKTLRKKLAPLSQVNSCDFAILKSFQQVKQRHEERVALQNSFRTPAADPVPPKRASNSTRGLQLRCGTARQSIRTRTALPRKAVRYGRTDHGIANESRGDELATQTGSGNRVHRRNRRGTDAHRRRHRAAREEPRPRRCAGEEWPGGRTSSAPGSSTISPSATEPRCRSRQTGRVPASRINGPWSPSGPRPAGKILRRQPAQIVSRKADRLFRYRSALLVNAAEVARNLGHRTFAAR